MSIPVDLPGGQKMHEWPAPHLQAGVQEVIGGGFKGVVLIGAAEGGEPRTHVCEGLHVLRAQAYQEALAYMEQHHDQALMRDDRSEHL